MFLCTNKLNNIHKLSYAKNTHFVSKYTQNHDQIKAASVGKCSPHGPYVGLYALNPPEENIYLLLF